MTKPPSAFRRREPCLLSPFRVTHSMASFTGLRRLASPADARHTPSTRPPDCRFSGFELSSRLKSLDVLGLGEAMIDYAVCVSEELLDEFQVVKGGRRVVNSEERSLLCRKLHDRCNLSAGSSVGNTLSAMAQLSSAFGRELTLGFGGCIGRDQEGQFYSAYLRNQHVEAMDCASDKERQTGCVIVMVTPDAQRTFLVDPGEGHLQLTEEIQSAIVRSKAIMIEGYLFGHEESLDHISEAVSIAKQNGTLVILTTGAAEVVRKSRSAMWNIIAMGVDVLLCNRSEAAALLEDEDCCAYEAVKQLGQCCPLVAVTDGSDGSFVICDGVLVTVPPYWKSSAPVDTCGAGDVYAAGLLVGRLLGYDLHRIGRLASQSASAIIVKHGTQLTPDDAAEIATDIQESVTSDVNVVYS